MKTLAQKIEQIEGLVGTTDVNAWEHAFILSIVDRYAASGKDTRTFSGKQVEIVDKIWEQHFHG